MESNKLRITLILFLFLLLGASLGASLTTFFFFLNTHIDSLMIFSYACVITFIIILVIEAILLYRNRHTLFKKGVDNYEKQD